MNIQKLYYAMAPEEKREMLCLLVPQARLELNEAEKAMIDEGQKIPAVRSYRNRIGCTLSIAASIVADYANKEI